MFVLHTGDQYYGYEDRDFKQYDWAVAEIASHRAKVPMDVLIDVVIYETTDNTVRIIECYKSIGLKREQTAEEYAKECEGLANG